MTLLLIPLVALLLGLVVYARSGGNRHRKWDEAAHRRADWLRNHPLPNHEVPHAPESYWQSYRQAGQAIDDELGIRDLRVI